MTFQRIFPNLIYEPGYYELAVAILRHAVNDLRNPCRRQTALNWFETGECCWLLDGIGINYEYMMIRVDDVLAMPTIEKRHYGPHKMRSYRERWKREKPQISG